MIFTFTFTPRSFNLYPLLNSKTHQDPFCAKRPSLFCPFFVVERNVCVVHLMPTKFLVYAQHNTSVSWRRRKRKLPWIVVDFCPHGRLPYKYTTASAIIVIAIIVIGHLPMPPYYLLRKNANFAHVLVPALSIPWERTDKDFVMILSLYPWLWI